MVTNEMVLNFRETLKEEFEEKTGLHWSDLSSDEQCDLCVRTMFEMFEEEIEQKN